MYGLLLFFLLLLYDSFTWYEVRRCAFRCCCIGGENVVVLSLPVAVHQAQTYTVTGVPGMRSKDACFIVVALEVKTLS